MLSDRKAEASAATIESAQTGQVGRSQPRGSGLGATVDGISATAGIVTSLRSEPRAEHTLICLTISQHKCVGFKLLDRIQILQCSEFLTRTVPACTRACCLQMRKRRQIYRPHGQRSRSWTNLRL